MLPHFLFYQGYLIEKILPGISGGNILAMNRIAQIIQFVAAAIILIEIMGEETATSIIAALSWPFIKVRDILWSWIEGEKPPRLRHSPR